MKDRISITVQDGIADVRLVRADKMNALDGAMFDAIAAAGEQLRGDTSVRVVVLSGEGRGFCAGLDVGNFAVIAEKSAERGADKSAEQGVEKGAGGGAGEQSTKQSDAAAIQTLSPRTHGIANKPQHAAWMWHELPVPVIAALHGVALGGGLQLALGADLRYAAPGTRLSIMEIKWGLVPDMAGTQRLRHLVRDDVIRELTYTGRILLAEEAQALGLVTKVCDDPLAAAMATAKEIAARNPDAIRADKRLLNDAPYLDRAAGLQLESRLQDGIIGSPNQLEAVAAEMEGRAANYTAPPSQT